MLVKVFSEVFSEWEGIGVCLEVAHNVMKDLEDKWKSKEKREWASCPCFKHL